MADATEWAPAKYDVGKRDFLWVQSEELHKARRKAILQAHPEVKSLMGREPLTLPLVLFVSFTQMYLAYSLRHTPIFSAPFLVTAYVIGGTLNQNTFLSIHDITHNLVFRSGKLNRLLAIWANLPIGLPFAMMFKKYHEEHHRFFGEDGYDTDLPTELELQLLKSTAGKLFFLTFQIFFYALRPTIVRRIPITGWIILNALAQIAFDIAVVRTWGWHPLVYFLLSSFFAGSLHPLAGHFIAEHYLFDGFDQETWSYYGPLNVLVYNTGYHNEHHDFPSVPWTRLPAVKALAPEFYETIPSHSSWPGVLWRFLWDGRVGIWRRKKRLHKVRGVRETSEGMHGYIDSFPVPMHLGFGSAPAAAKGAKGKGKEKEAAQYDVVANWTAQERDDVERKVAMAALLGYSTVLLKVGIPPSTNPSTLAFPTPLFPSLDPRTAKPGTEGLVLQLWRIEVTDYTDDTIKSTSIKGNYGLSNSTAPLFPPSTTLLSLSPPSLSVFSHAALSLSPPSLFSPSLLTFDPSLSARLPFPLKRGLVNTLLRAGVFFEITLRGILSQDEPNGSTAGTRRRNWIAGAREIVRATGGKSVVISSGAVKAGEMRASEDLINLCSLIGLTASQAKDALTINPQRAILRGLSLRQAYRGVISNPTLTTTVDESAERAVPIVAGAKRDSSAFEVSEEAGGGGGGKEGEKAPVRAGKKRKA
ncbi:hypothetical protein RQP46_003920 [Phenoliferia psychrophenolica]